MLGGYCAGLGSPQAVNVIAISIAAKSANFIFLISYMNKYDELIIFKYTYNSLAIHI
ncbi:hypothetical protein NMYAN_40179 [Nitrosomonas nitrosa]|uniref:Uncharacterized protein n=1 Tax=Nitrosomonas nitrosa TaxID=52442 RepID=A0A8H8Z1D0_9PROT|nr:hypothetical protein NMYAN_40179 [Nitrosomonas nitrosa]